MNAQQVYDNHEVLMLHGQRVCFYQNPACQRCVVSTSAHSGKLACPKALYIDKRVER